MRKAVEKKLEAVAAQAKSDAEKAKRWDQYAHTQEVEFKKEVESLDKRVQALPEAGQKLLARFLSPDRTWETFSEYKEALELAESMARHGGSPVRSQLTGNEIQFSTADLREAGVQLKRGEMTKVNEIARKTGATADQVIQQAWPYRL